MVCAVCFSRYLAANPRLLELLIKTFDASRYAGDLLIRRPQLLEEITRGCRLDVSLGRRRPLATAKCRFVRSASETRPVRAYRQMQWLRILLRDVLELGDGDSTFAEHSALAEACLISIAATPRQQNDPDRLSAWENLAAAKLPTAPISMSCLSARTRGGAEISLSRWENRRAEGNISPLDARLRPDGEKGPLVSSFARIRSVLRKPRSTLGTAGANQSARDLAARSGEFVEMAQRSGASAGQRENLFAQIDAHAGTNSARARQRIGFSISKRARAE